MTVQYGARTVTSEPFSKRTAGRPSSSTRRRASGAARQSLRNWSRRSSKSVVPSGRRERIMVVGSEQTIDRQLDVLKIEFDTKRTASMCLGNSHDRPTSDEWVHDDIPDA